MKRFKRVYVEITNVCNLKCDFCPQTKRPEEFMDVETFRNILYQIRNYTDYLYFHIKGEPLLHPQLDQFLDISHEMGFQVNITTNGTLINKVKDKIILKPALRQINFSLHSFDGNVGFNKKDDYINNILSFVKDARDKSNTIISLRLWNLEENNQANIEKQRNRDLIEIIQNEFNLQYEIDEKVIPGRGTKIADKVYLNMDYQFQWPDLKEKEDDGLGFCYGLRNQIGILVDGTVVPCCLDGEGVINLGNIKKTSFTEVINSDRANHIVDGFSNKKAVEEFCRKCGYRKRFGKS